jgi:hypothetical protein
LSGGDEGLILANVDQQVVRVDNTATVRETIDMGTAQWERVAKFELSLDPRQPTFIEWKDILTAELSSPADTFGPDVVWDKPYGWENERSGEYVFGFGELYGMNPVYRDVNKRPIKTAGFISTVDDAGNELLIMREVVKFPDGTLGEWLFMWDPAIIDPQYKEAWYQRTLENDALFQVPWTKLTPEAPCTGMSSEYVCSVGASLTAAEMKKLVEEGVWTGAGTRRLFVPSGVWWENP